MAAALVAGVFVAVESTRRDWSGFWRPAVVILVVTAIFGVLLGQSLLRTRRGQRLLTNKERRLHQKYSGDLHAGRRWLPFYYRGEDISTYIPQILYVIESERRFDSVHDALAFVKYHSRDSTKINAHELNKFNAVAAQANLVVVSSTNEAGQPTSRIMNFVKTEKPGVWYVTTAPDGPKAHEFDRGQIALITPPSETGATISSNRVHIKRADETFLDIADLYRAQVPGYVDGMTEAEQRIELVYELTLQSAKVDTWLEHDLVVFCEPGEVSR
jgi:hypothetical protein